MASRRGGNPRIVIGADSSAVKRETREAAGAVDTLKTKTTHSFKESAKGAAGAALGFVGLTGAVYGAKEAIGGSIQAAAEAEKSQAKLEAQLKASGISWRAHRDEIDAVIQKTSKLAGLDDEDLQDAFVNLVRASGSVNKSLREMGLVADIARAKHMDVAKVGQLVGKVMDGNVSSLSRYGITVKPVTAAQDKLAASTKKATTEQTRAAKEADKQATAQRALALMQQKFSGQAEGYGKTTAGAVDRMHVAFENLGETVGGVVAPALGRAANRVADFVNGMQDGTGAGGRFRDVLDDIYQKAKPVIRFLKDHPKVIAGAIGAWAAYKVAARVASLAFKVSTFKANLAKSVPVAAEQGALSGRAYATSFDTAAAGGIGRAAKGGKAARASRAFGKALGLAGAAAMALAFKPEIERIIGDFLDEAASRVKDIGDNLDNFHPLGIGGKETTPQTLRERAGGGSSGGGGKSTIGVSNPSTGGVGGFPKKTAPIKAPNSGKPKAGTSAVARTSGVKAKASGKPPRKATYNHSELMALWVWAGGPSAVADTAAAIALAESGGVASVVNSIGATGLWQIYNGNGEVPGARDPYTNAQMAVAKYRGAGNKFTPWTVYTGYDTPGHAKTYLQYMTGAQGPSGGSGGSSGGGSGSSGPSASERAARTAAGTHRTSVRGKRASAVTAAKAMVLTNSDRFEIGMADADILETETPPGTQVGRGLGTPANLARRQWITRRIAWIKKRLKKRISASERVSLKQELASLKGQLKDILTPAEMPEPIGAGGADTASLPSGIGAAISLAALTPENTDDVAAFTQAQGFWQGALDDAKAKGDNDAIITAANELKSVNDTLDQIRQNGEDQLALMQTRLDLEKQRGDALQRSLDVSQAQYPAFMAAVLAGVNEGLGQSVGAPRPIASTSVARL